MFSVVVIVTQLLAVIFIGAFGRSTSSDSTSTTYLLNNLIMLAAFTIMYTPYKKLALHSYVLLLVVMCLVLETYLLFGTFWDSCFNGFSEEFEINNKLLVRASFAMLAVLLTVLDFVGVFAFWQVHLLFIPVMVIGYALNSAVLLLGLKIFDGGVGMQAFLYSAVISFMIWVISVRGKVTVSLHKKAEHYTGHTLSLVGMMVCLVTWPQFNASGALVTVSNTQLGQSATLEASALPNTLLAISVGILVSLLFVTNENSKTSKMKIRTSVDCFTNAAIVVASYSDIQLNPAAGMTIAMFVSIATLIFNRYARRDDLNLAKEDVSSVFIIIQHYCPVLFRFVCSLLGSIVCAIVVATRESRTPALLSSDYSRIAGLEIAGFFVTLGFGLVFGGICGVIINCFIKYKIEHSENAIHDVSKSALTDLDFFDDLNEEIFPLYLKKDDQFLQEDETARRVIKESLLSHIKDKQNSQTKKNQEERIDPLPIASTIIISNNFTKSNLRNPYAEVSQMKNNQIEERVSQNQENPQMEPLNTDQKPSMTVRKSYLNENQLVQEMIKMEPVARKIQYDSELSNIEEENKNKDPQ